MPNDDHKVTFVTGLWDIGRGDLNGSWQRSFESYVQHLLELLKCPFNFVVFGDEKLRRLIYHESNPGISFIPKPLGEFVDNNFDLIQKIRTNRQWLNLADWLSDSPQATLEYYNPIVFSKVSLVIEAVEKNEAKAVHVFWIDAGITRTVNPSILSAPEVRQKLTELNKISFLAYPYKAQNEIHGFEYDAMNRYCRGYRSIVCRGGFFGGPTGQFEQFSYDYADILRDSLEQGFMGTEESIFTIMAHTFPERYLYASVNQDGLLYRFFQRLKTNTAFFQHMPTRSSEVSCRSSLKKKSVALYILSFNSPIQFAELLLSFSAADINFLTQPNIYLIDNSTIPETYALYEELCDVYNITHIKKDNLGISGGRQFAAEHAHKNHYDFHFYFEDDMLLIGKSNLKECKSGLNRSTINLYNKSLHIAEQEQLDFLKLSFSEFFGSNSAQWAWFNVTPVERTELWSNHNYHPSKGLSQNIPFTSFKEFGNHGDISYAIGEIFYSNWPQLISKKGNVKMFIHNKTDHPSESNWMRRFYFNVTSNTLKAGILLLSPIRHHRFDHYPNTIRKES